MASRYPKLSISRRANQTFSASASSRRWVHHVGLGEPPGGAGRCGRGAYFEVMGLRPVLGRLLDMPGTRAVRRRSCGLSIGSGQPGCTAIGRIGKSRQARHGNTEHNRRRTRAVISYPAETEISRTS